MTDTSPEIAALVKERLAARSGTERFLMGSRMFNAARAIVLASFPDDLSDAERGEKLYERFYGAKLPVTAE